MLIALIIGFGGQLTIARLATIPVMIATMPHDADTGSNSLIRPYHVWNPLGVILAGGLSRRMGQDKAALQLDGQSLLACGIHALQGAGLSVLVVGRSGASAAGLSYCDDDAPGQGPLGGIITALRHAAGQAVLVVPCDVPSLRTADVRWLLKCWQNNQSEVCAARRDDVPEPLFAIYSPQVLPVFERLLATGQASVMKALAAVATTTVALPPEHLGAVCDVDTPVEWQQFRDRR